VRNIWNRKNEGESMKKERKKERRKKERKKEKEMNIPSLTWDSC
jgi:hypothetical protein